MVKSTAIYPSLRDKNVLISGGAEGIGAAAVELFALQGCQVIFLDIARDSARKTIDHVVSASKEMTSRNGGGVKTPVFYFCDVTDLEELHATAKKTLDEFGVIHVLVNNAAAAAGAARLETAKVMPEAWDSCVNVNLRHVFFLTQALVPAMQAAGGGGSIVNMGSIGWRVPVANQPVYCACKAAIMGLTRAHSKEFGPSGVRVNSVMPGAIATERQKEQVLTPEYRAHVMQAQSLKHDLVPEDVAKLIVFLASDEASGVTGSTYVVDGGWCSDP